MEMQVAEELQTVQCQIEDNEVFVLVLQPTEYEKSDILQTQICGRSVIDWVKSAISPWHHKFVLVEENDDILTVFRKNITSAKWTVIVYADMPLLTETGIKSALEYATMKEATAVALPRGYVCDTEFAKMNEDFALTEFRPDDMCDYISAGNATQIAKIRADIQNRINFAHIANGVQIISPKDTYIDAGVEIGKDAIIEPNTYLYGETKIGERTQIMSGTRIEDSIIGSDTVINASEIFESSIGDKCQIGPNAHIRPSSKIGDNVRIGNFVEIKKSTIGDGTKVAHLTYIGDGSVGKNCNVGCGVVFVNFNGKEKLPTTVGDNAFIGSNSSLIAPLTVGDNAFIAAGSTITDDVPADALAIARARQAIKENWNKAED